jgi:hypothetical protein
MCFLAALVCVAWLFAWMSAFGMTLESWKQWSESTKLFRATRSHPTDGRELNVHSRHLGLKSCKQWGDGHRELWKIAILRGRSVF